MKIILVKTMTNGSQATHHEISQIVIRPTGIEATVISRTEGGVLCWQDTHMIDAQAFEGAPMACAASFLTGAGGALEGGVVSVFGDDLEELRLTVLSKINSYRDALILGGCETPFGVVQTDEISIRNILGSVQTATIMMSGGQPFQVGWRMSDNVDVVLNAQEMIQLGLIVMGHINAVYERSFALKDMIAAADRETLEAFEVAARWNDVLINKG